MKRDINEYWAGLTALLRIHFKKKWEMFVIYDDIIRVYLDGEEEGLQEVIDKIDKFNSTQNGHKLIICVSPNKKTMLIYLTICIIERTF